MAGTDPQKPQDLPPPPVDDGEGAPRTEEDASVQFQPPPADERVAAQEEAGVPSTPEALQAVPVELLRRGRPLTSSCATALGERLNLRPRLRRHLSTPPWHITRLRVINDLVAPADEKVEHFLPTRSPYVQRRGRADEWFSCPADVIKSPCDAERPLACAASFAESLLSGFESQ
jgi:hypothetical protein